jgi:metal-responsive CopG/Arc/MetJ family transcriptional regulator
MRTTIEINDRHRAALLELAARRGEKGFSVLVRDALDAYLKEEKSRRDWQRGALRLRGSLSPHEGGALKRHITRLRRSWR